MGGVLHDTFCFAGASCKENIQDGGERGTNDFCSGVHCPLEGLAVCCTTVSVPDSDAAGQHYIYRSCVGNVATVMIHMCNNPYIIHSNMCLE